MIICERANNSHFCVAFYGLQMGLGDRPCWKPFVHRLSSSTAHVPAPPLPANGTVLFPPHFPGGSSTDVLGATSPPCDPSVRSDTMQMVQRHLSGCPPNPSDVRMPPPPNRTARSLCPGVGTSPTPSLPRRAKVAAAPVG